MKLWFERGAWASDRAKSYFRGRSRHDIKSIAVIRHAALGDMVITRPFLVEARKFFPNAKITLSLVSNYMAGAPTDLADRVHVISGREVRGITLFDRIREARQIGGPDLIFDLADTTRSRYICLLNQSNIRIGVSYSPLLSRLLHDACVWRSDFVFECENMLHALMLLGADPKRPIDFAWPPPVQPGRQSKRPQVLYFPFASTTQKTWPANHWRDLLFRMAVKRPDCDHLVLSGIDVHERSESINDSRFVQHTNVVFLPPMELDAMSLRIRDASCLVSNDTGVRNLAIALGTKTIGIFFSTVPFRYLPTIPDHIAVFDSNGSIPTIDQVEEGVHRCLSGII